MPLAMTTSTAHRLRKHADFQRVYKAGRKQFSKQIGYFHALRTPECQQRSATTGPRIGLTVPKALGKAVDRNRIKRRMREVVRKHLDELPAGFDLILHPRRSVMTMDFAKLDAEVLRIFRQAAAQASGFSRPAPRNAAR